MAGCMLSSFTQQIEELTKKPEKYLSIEKYQEHLAKQLTKSLYDFTKGKENPKNSASDVLKRLVITNLDEEQIWQQIDLQNNSVCNNLVNEIAYLSAKKEILHFPLKDKKKEVKSNVPEKKKENKVKNKNENKVEQNEKKKSQKGPKWKSSIVDDKFFKLREMENFLEAVEKEEEKEVINNKDKDDYDDDDDDDDVEYFEGDVNDDNEEQFYYNDFFDQPDEVCDENDEVKDENNTESDKKKVKFMLDEKQDEDEDEGEGEEGDDLDSDEIEDLYDFDEDIEDNNDENIGSDDGDDDNFNDYSDDNNDNESDEDDDEDKEKAVKQPSTFELRQERLKSRIKNLEEEALKEKPWQLKGEVTASSRPQNSLLEEYVEFDIASRPAPVLTEKSTLKLEDVIIQRIKDKAWDDVVRKIKPVENDVEYRKKLVLDQEKSKLSLAQIYEKEYLKQLESKNEDMSEKPEKEPPEHQEIRIMMNKLFKKLDALSNFHFTPNQIAPDVKIVSNLPAINMEEVAPVATSDAALLAPEEVKPKLKGDLIGKNERTATDKNRQKRKRKLKQKLMYKQMEAKTKSNTEKSDSKNSQKKKISQNFLQKITKSSNVTQLNETKNDKYVKSSNAFFSKLQDETRSLIKKKSLDMNKTKFNKKITPTKSRAR